MKKFVLFVLTLALIIGTVIFVPSCKEKSRVEDMLAFERGTPEYDIVYTAGTGEYDMKLTLGSHSGEYAFRDGRAEITDGVLKGVSFEMTSGELKMSGDGFEYSLTETDSPAIYALFSAFGIEASSYADLTKDENGREIAKFNGKHEFTVVFGDNKNVPEEIIINADGAEYTVKFK